MARGQGIERADSAGRHGYSLADVLYAARHVTRKRMYVLDGETYVKLTGLRHGDPLVASIEVAMKMTGAGTLVVFHVNAETDGFFERD